MLLTKITIDVNKPLYTKLTAKSGDMKSRFIEFHMYNGVEPLSLDHCHVRFYMIKPDNTIIFNDLVKNSNDGICTLELTSQCLAVEGKGKCELIIFQDGSKLSTIPFEIDIIKSINDSSAIESFNEMGSLESALGRIDGVDDRIDDLETAVHSINQELDTIDNRVGELVANTSYRFIGTTFNQNDMKLVVMYSDDGSFWYCPNPQGDFTSTIGNGTLRDPSMLKHDDTFFICYTKIAWGTGHVIGYCHTKDFRNFEEEEMLDLGSQFIKIWAPEFFRDSITKKEYIVFNGSTSVSGTDDFRGYLQEISINDNVISLIGQPVQITGDMTNQNAIDFSMIQDNGKYYVVYKDENLKTMCIAESYYIDHDYYTFVKDKFKYTEGHQIVKTENGYRIYLDRYENDQLGYVDSSDGFMNFTDIITIGYPNGFHGRHMNVYDTKKVSATTNQASVSGIFKGNGNQAIPNNSDTLVVVGDYIFSTGIAQSADGTTAIIEHDGMYLVTANAGWEDNNKGFRTLAIEHVEHSQNDLNKAVAISQVQAVQNNQTHQSVSAVVHCKRGDGLRISVKQTSGSVLRLVNWYHSAVLTINKL